MLTYPHHGPISFTYQRDCRTRRRAWNVSARIHGSSLYIRCSFAEIFGLYSEIALFRSIPETRPGMSSFSYAHLPPVTSSIQPINPPSLPNLVIHSIHPPPTHSIDQLNGVIDGKGRWKELIWLDHTEQV